MADENYQMIERHSPPTEMDSLAQYGRCKVSEDSIWVQVAQEEKTPNWIEFKSLDEALKFIDEKKSI